VQPAGGMVIRAGNRAHEIEDGIALGKP
jgi:hypothetical protein